MKSFPITTAPGHAHRAKLPLATPTERNRRRLASRDRFHQTAPTNLLRAICLLPLRFRTHPLISKQISVTADAGDLCISRCACALSCHADGVGFITYVISASGVALLTESRFSTCELTDISTKQVRTHRLIVPVLLR